MASADLCLHAGGRQVTREELNLVPCPPAEGRWRPVRHGEVLDYCLTGLDEAGYKIQKMELGLARDDQRFWGTIVLQSNIVQGVSLAVAVASSLDKSLSLRWGYGSRVWVCDNGAWSMEKSISRKHTTNAVVCYQQAIQKAISDLGQYKQIEATRINRLQNVLLTHDQCDSLLLRAFEEKILSPRSLPVAIAQLRRPDFPEFEEPNAWSIFNHITFALGPRAKANAQAHAAATIKLAHLFARETGAETETFVSA